MEEAKKQIGTSMVMMTLPEYDGLIKQQADQEARIEQLSGVLERYSQFMQKLDGDPDVVALYSKCLEKENKIGSAFYEAFKEFVELKKMKLV